jgi:hypothetical protein
MNLHLLWQTPCLTAYYDLHNDWLYLDWQGELSLPDVQQACLELAACYLKRPYSHILNSNEHVTGVNWRVAAWLATDFLPHMTIAGVEHVAWIYSPSLRGHNLVQTVLNWLPGSVIAAFSTTAEAVEWLQHTRTTQSRGYLLPTRLPATQAKLAQVVQELRQRVAEQPQQRKLRRA